MKYLHENGCPWDELACEYAAGRGHLNCLKYLYENGCPWNSDACTDAAFGGHLECLKYLHKNGCPWNEEAYAYAVSEGNLQILKYLHENGCQWYERVCIIAARGGHFECLKYLLEHDCPTDVDTYKLCVKKCRKKTWFQVYMYVKKRIINKYTLHIHHKVLRIQRAWHRYAYNPESKIGQERMLKSMSENNDELERIM